MFSALSQERFPVGSQIVHIGAQHYGSPGVVRSVDVVTNGAKEEVRLTLELSKRPVMPASAFRRFVAQGELRYFPSYQVRRYLTQYNIFTLIYVGIEIYVSFMK